MFLLSRIGFSFIQLYRAFLAFSFLLVLSLQSFAGPTTRIAILDTPIDYDYPDLKALVDEDLLAGISLVDEKGQEKTWHQLNQEVKANIQSKIAKNMYADQIELFDAQNEIEGGYVPRDQLKSVLLKRVRGELRYMFSAKFRAGYRVIASYLHGTHVAGIALRSLTDTKFINFPMSKLELDDRLSLSQILNYDPAHTREKYRSYFEQISRILQKNNIRIVNLSWGVSPQDEYDFLKKRSTLFQKTFFRARLKNMGVEEARIIREEYASFFSNNPNSVFVIAAGNEGLDVTQTSVSTLCTLKADNLVKVGALNQNGMPASYSNYSSDNVDITAEGSGVVSAMVGGGEIHMSGTSMAAPKVTNVLAQILEDSPDLSIKDLIHKLYNSYTIKNAKLSNFVVNGRRLVQGRKNRDGSGSSFAKDLNFEVEKSVSVDSCSSLFSQP